VHNINVASVSGLYIFLLFHRVSLTVTITSISILQDRKVNYKGDSCIYLVNVYFHICIPFLEVEKLQKDMQQALVEGKQVEQMIK
jgi:hypothetical protein